MPRPTFTIIILSSAIALFVGASLLVTMLISRAKPSHPQDRSDALPLPTFKSPADGIASLVVRDQHLSAELHEADLKHVLEEIGRQSNVRIGYDPAPPRNVSASFQRTPLYEALRQLLRTNYLMGFSWDQRMHALRLSHVDSLPHQPSRPPSPTQTQRFLDDRFGLLFDYPISWGPVTRATLNHDYFSGYNIDDKLRIVLPSKFVEGTFDPYTFLEDHTGDNTGDDVYIELADTPTRTDIKFWFIDYGTPDDLHPTLKLAYYVTLAPERRTVRLEPTFDVPLPLPSTTLIYDIPQEDIRAAARKAFIAAEHKHIPSHLLRQLDDYDDLVKSLRPSRPPR